MSACCMANKTISHSHLRAISHRALQFQACRAESDHLPTATLERATLRLPVLPKAQARSLYPWKRVILLYESSTRSETNRPTSQDSDLCKYHTYNQKLRRGVTVYAIKMMKMVHVPQICVREHNQENDRNTNFTDRQERLGP